MDAKYGRQFIAENGIDHACHHLWHREILGMGGRGMKYTEIVG